MGQYSSLQAITPAGIWFNTTASVNVVSGQGQIVGVVINSHSGGSVKVYDGLNTSGSVVFNTITFATSEHFIPFFGARFKTGIYLAIGGTADITLIFNK